MRNPVPGAVIPFDIVKKSIMMTSLQNIQSHRGNLYFFPCLNPSFLSHLSPLSFSLSHFSPFSLSLSPFPPPVPHSFLSLFPCFHMQSIFQLTFPPPLSPVCSFSLLGCLILSLSRSLSLCVVIILYHSCLFV